MNAKADAIIPYSGRCVDDLITTEEKVRGANAAVDLYKQVDEALDMSLMYRETFGAKLLDHCMTHLTDRRANSRYPDFDESDIAAWECMKEIRDFLWNGSLCIHCGRSEWVHTPLGQFCARRGVKPFKRFTPKNLNFATK